MLQIFAALLEKGWLLPKTVPAKMLFFCVRSSEWRTWRPNGNTAAQVFCDSDLVFHGDKTHPERSFPLMSLSNATLSIYIYCRTLCGIFSKITEVLLHGTLKVVTLR